MSDHYERHAEEVARAFMDLLDDDVRAAISEDHRNELAMLVEAAISTAVLGEMERAADKVAELSNSLRHHAEHYEKTG